MAMTSNEIPNSRPTLTGTSNNGRGGGGGSSSKINNGSGHMSSMSGSGRWRTGAGRRRPLANHGPPKKLLSNSRSSGRGLGGAGIRGLESSIKQVEDKELLDGRLKLAAEYHDDTDDCESSDMDDSSPHQRGGNSSMSSSMSRSLRLGSSRRSRSGGRRSKQRRSFLGGSLRESISRTTSIDISDGSNNSANKEEETALESSSRPRPPAATASSSSSAAPKRPGRRPSFARRSILSARGSGSRSRSRSKSAINQGDLLEMRRLVADEDDNSNDDDDDDDDDKNNKKILNEAPLKVSLPSTSPPTTPTRRGGGGRKPLLSARGSKSAMNTGDLMQMRRMVSYPNPTSTTPSSRVLKRPPLRQTISQSFKATAGNIVQRSKSSAPELMQMQQSLINGVGGAFARSATSDRPATIRRTRSSLMPPTLRRQRSTAADPDAAAGSAGVANAEKDPFMVEMMQLNPTDPQDRSKFDDYAVKRTIRSNPDAARAMYDFPVGGRGNLTVSRYPLSGLIALGASMDTLRWAIRANPHALEADGKANRSNALHTACAFNAGVDIVKFLYTKHPTAISETTSFVFLPIHNACQATNPSLDMIKFLVQNYPDGLMAINKLGDTPLRTAQRNDSVSPEVLAYLESETSKVFDQCDENKRRKAIIQARQSWGSIPALKKEMFGDTGSSLELKKELFDGSSHELKQEELLDGGTPSMELSIPDLEEMASDVSSF